MRIIYSMIFFLLLPCHASASITKCEDSSGKLIFTDNPLLCAAKIENITIKNINIQVNDHAKESAVNYRSPARTYQSEHLDWEIYYEQGLIENDQTLYLQSKQKLDVTLNKIEAALPADALRKLKNVKIFLMWGEASPLGGERSGMRYVRPGETRHREHYDPRWENSIIIYSASNLVYLNDLWAQKALTHEFAHAWHLLNWPEKHPPILEAWKNADSKGLYQNVEDTKGDVIDSAYARSNQLEYFAEVSAIYFVGGNYHPFNKSGLYAYDRFAYDLVENLWGIK